MPEFHQTILGRMYYEAHVPNMIKQLESIAHELKRQNDFNEDCVKYKTLQEVADEVGKYEPRLAMIIDVLSSE